jgi:hypothetical protein
MLEYILQIMYHFGNIFYPILKQEQMYVDYQLILQKVEYVSEFEMKENYYKI